MSRLQGNYVVRGEFLRFHHSPSYNEKILSYNKFIDRLAERDYILREFYREEGSLIRLHAYSKLFEELQGGTILLLHVPPEERARIDGIRWDEKLQMERELYIDWGNEPCEFRTVRVEKGLISSGELGKRVTLDELIGSGKVLEPFCGESTDLHGREVIKRYAERIQDSFYILRLTLHRKKSWFKERWTWTLGVEYISKEKGNS